MNEPSLLPCPFCGGPAGFEAVGTEDRTTWTVGCVNNNVDCIGYMMLASFIRKEEAAEAYNKRTPQTNQALVSWAVRRWQNEVSNRPLTNINRRPLDDTWRQVIRYFGANDVELCGPRHDDLLNKGHGQ